MNSLNLNDVTVCKSQHKWSGKVPTNNDEHLEGQSCDCGKLIIKFEGCGCGGKKKFKYEHNKDYIPNY